ncbi:alpha-L-fucosidase [Chitinophaga barathri]|uniref:alpha-L-fucosidase n=1 Tax=Chitinophaga barathri TaxID=1647451 RepID=A0A3N4M891_9BACT|nr:alpha-L-fucosidase [Chitinophaga barathri]RPD39578.1 hypothetical protein EG028_18145 [Chitinophaga barathri]
MCLTRFRSIYCLVLVLAGATFNSSAQSRDSIKAFDNWRDMRVGLFIHWGPSSGKALPQSHSHARKSDFNPHGSVPAEVYDKFYTTFNPVKYDPDQWLKLAYDAGMRYTVFVAKHHDGFCMFKTDATDYNIMATPYGKDVAKMFSDACKRNGMALGWQISPKDWKHPDFSANQDKYNKYYGHLVGELTENYGPVSVLWFDGIEPVPQDKWKEVSETVPGLVYARNPNTMLGVHGAVKEDFLSFEYMVGPFDRNKPWETCEAINPSGWVYNKPMPAYPFRNLLRNLVYTVARDGNYLLDVGPMETGELFPADAERLRQFAGWMKINAEAIHGTRGGPYRDGEWGGATCKEKFVYLFVSDKVGDKLVLPLPGANITAAGRLDGGLLKHQVKGSNLVLQFPDREKGEKPIFTVVRLTLDKPALSLPITDGQLNLANAANVKASSIRDNNGSLYGPALLFDNKGETAWQDKKEDTLSTLQFTLEAPAEISGLALSERGQTEEWGHYFAIQLKVRNSEKEPWRIVLTQKGMLGAPPILSFEKTTARFVALDIRKKAGIQLQISELRLFAPLAE